ncbi:MAG: hypothetical protein A2017_09540 [Lentisphaerae bacterium GWF2_44_16]|nr:MAG: hypothetical protein A2017_09540 [Lentisphaerae bacterium GWF2_44_16]
MKNEEKNSIPGFALTRREALKLGLWGMAGFFVSDFLSFSIFADALKPVFSGGKAKSVIQIWLAGGPSHLDTFDPKPGAGYNYCGPYNKPIETNVDGIQICQMLPLLAKQADKYSIIRGMTHGNNGHETAAYMMQTGRKTGGNLVYPGIGALVSYFKGYDGGYKGMLPPYITVTSPLGRFSEAGFIGSRYKSFSTGSDPNRPLFAVEGIISEKIKNDRLASRKALLGKIDTFGSLMASDPAVAELDNFQEQAYSVITGDVGKAFQFTEEKNELRDEYGRNKFGQSCLLARRLVERGVPFVTINDGGWDHHKQIFPELNKRLPVLDKGVATLLRELAERGLLDSTVVYVCGEFGRTPKILWEAPWNGGRGHYGKAFSVLIAGGGFKGGRLLGKTDERGETVTERPVYPWDLNTGILGLLGVSPDAKLPHPQGKDVFASALASGEIPEKERGGILNEIM